MVRCTEIQLCTAVAVLASLALPGCGDDDCCTMAHYDAGVDVVLPQDANTSLTEVALVPATANNELDLLFVVDDTTRMLDKQQRLAAAVPSLLNALRTNDGSLQLQLPSLHVGVVTTDMGTTGTADTTPGGTFATCVGTGKDGTLQKGTATLDDAFLKDERNGDSPRVTNYSGAIADVLGQMLNVGDVGCGIEQPLAAMERALGNPANAGFVRESARLAVVVVTDEDDCSFMHSTFTKVDTATNEALGDLGFRCTRHGVTCDGGGQDAAQMNIPGTKTDCRANDASAYVTSVDHYAGVLRDRKPSPRDVLFASIAGPPTPFEVELDPTAGQTFLGASCQYDTADDVAKAVPAVRLADLSARVPNGARVSICDDFGPALGELGHRIRNLLGTSACLGMPIAIPAACEAVDIDAAGSETVIPACVDGGAVPCLSITQNLEHCPIVQGLELEIRRASPADADTWTSVRCML